MRQIVEYTNVDLEHFQNEIAPANQPAVFKGFVRNWPAVSAANQSIAAICDYIKQLDQHVPARLFLGRPDIKGRFWYDAEMRGLNFETVPESLTGILDRLIAHLSDAEPPAIYAGSVSIGQVMPQFMADNSIPLLSSHIEPRIWIGNKTTIQTHYDVSENLACVVAGRRRFILFPPEQLPNLYIGPLNFNMAGAPVSMVQLKDPDLNKYPNFKYAIEAAYSTELDPGDVLYIPYMWWHHVESLSPFNVLVTYWWDRAHPNAGSAFTAMMHAIMAIHSLPADRRAIWKQHFDHFVFETNGDPTAHLKMHEKGILHPMNSELAMYMKRWLLQELTRS